nr:hypothetical protein StreXyl84_29100 [Streptomyces sp. Xyl84]
MGSPCVFPPCTCHRERVGGPPGVCAESVAHAQLFPGQTHHSFGKGLVKAVIVEALRVHVHLLMHVHMNKVMIRFS